MGTHTTAEFMDLFGGMPEPGEAIPDMDAIRDGAREGVAPCGCDGHGQVRRNASGDDSVVNALSYVSLCRDKNCEARRDAAFMGVSDDDLERYF